LLYRSVLGEKNSQSKPCSIKCLKSLKTQKRQ
jgi:hypothetical protein